MPYYPAFGPPACLPLNTLQSPGDVTLRACAFSTDTGLGSFATLPLAKHVSGMYSFRLHVSWLYCLFCLYCLCCLDCLLDQDRHGLLCHTDPGQARVRWVQHPASGVLCVLPVLPILPVLLRLVCATAALSLLLVVHFTILQIVLPAWCTACTAWQAC